MLDLTRRRSAASTSFRLRWLRAVLLLGLGLVIWLESGLAVAQQPPAVVDAGQRAAAETLFNEALALLEQGNAAEACPKLEESQRLDAGIGTLLYLADCYRTLGRTASAWGTFLDASYAARAAGDEREAIAVEQARVLESQLSYLTLEVAPQLAAELELSNDGQPVRPALWGTKIPVDPGEHRLEARASGYEPWQATVTIAPGPAEQHVRVPALVKELVLPAPAPVSEPVVAKVVDVPPPPDHSRRIAGWALVGAGGASLVTSGVLALLASSDDRAADDECRADSPGLCNERGVELADSARTKATIAGIAAGVGVAAIGGGVALLLWPEQGAAASAPAATRPPARRALGADARISADGARFVLEGRW
jgi:serine/threonine-protein kinase